MDFYLSGGRMNDIEKEKLRDICRGLMYVMSHANDPMEVQDFVDQTMVKIKELIGDNDDTKSD
jgi:hypothetical protein